MPIKKSELYSSLWASCDELRGGRKSSTSRNAGRLASMSVEKVTIFKANATVNVIPEDKPSHISVRNKQFIDSIFVLPAPPNSASVLWQPGIALI
jgi:hypothetical protein